MCNVTSLFSGTILASDSGAPVLAASHPIWIAPALLASPTVRVVTNVAIFIAGDVDTITTGATLGLAKMGATLAALALVRKASKMMISSSK